MKFIKVNNSHINLDDISSISGIRLAYGIGYEFNIKMKNGNKYYVESKSESDCKKIMHEIFKIADPEYYESLVNSK